jgi:hypothetical protein
LTLKSNHFLVDFYSLSCKVDQLSNALNQPGEAAMKNLFPSLILISVLSLLICTCGDKDKGSAGSVSMAAITPSNAEDLLMSAYHGGFIPSMIPSPTESEDTSTPPAMVEAAKIIARHAQPAMMKFTEKGSKSVERIEGPCGGYAFMEVTGTRLRVTASYTMTDYCEDSITMNGSMTFIGLYRFEDGEYILYSVYFDFDSTEISSDWGTITVNGTLIDSLESIDDVYKRTIVMNQSIVDWETPDKTYSFDDYVAVITSDTAQILTTVSGKYTHSVHGSVSITTPLIVLSLKPTEDGYYPPHSGELKITGKNGSSASLHFIGDNKFYFECDQDGNGSIDWTSETYSW